MGVSFDVTSYKDDITEAFDAAADAALEIIGVKAEKYAKALCPVGTPESTGKKGYRGGTLRNSITHEVTENAVILGTNVFYAPYVELGTGPYFTPPPLWEEFDAPTPQGIGSGYVRPRKFIQPALLDHMDEYRDIIYNELNKVVK